MKDWRERLDQARFQIEVAQSFGAEKMLQDIGAMDIGEALEVIAAMVALMAERSRQD